MQGAKLQYGHVPVGTRGDDDTSRQFGSLHAVQRHMVDRCACKMVYEDNEDEYDDFYDYSALDEVDTEGGSDASAVLRFMCQRAAGMCNVHRFEDVGNVPTLGDDVSKADHAGRVPRCLVQLHLWVSAADNALRGCAQQSCSRMEPQAHEVHASSCWSPLPLPSPGHVLLHRIAGREMVMADGASEADAQLGTGNYELSLPAPPGGSAGGRRVLGNRSFALYYRYA